MGDCRSRPGTGLGEPKPGVWLPVPALPLAGRLGSGMLLSSQSLFPPLRDLSTVVPPVRGHSDGEAEGDV